MNCSISELIYQEALIFSLKFIFCKEYYFQLFSLFFSFSKIFWTSFAIVTAGSKLINKCLSPKHKISEPGRYTFLWQLSQILCYFFVRLLRRMLRVRNTLDNTLLNVNNTVNNNVHIVDLLHLLSTCSKKVLVWKDSV